MREICADSDFDFVAAEPRRKSEGGKRAKTFGAKTYGAKTDGVRTDGARRGKSRKKTIGSAFARLRAMGRYITPFLGVAALVALLGAVVVNAMFLQHGKHPAPLLGSTIRIEPPKPARPATMESLIAEKLLASPAAPLAAPQPQAAAPAPAAPAAPPVKKSHDAIGALIAGGGVAAVKAKGVLSAQRALEKLGAPLKADGDFGAATRRAVEAFQRDNSLPVTGQLTARTRRLLSARSGVSVD